MCLVFLPSKAKESDLVGEMIRCDSCTKWVHRKCDRMLEDPQIEQRFEDGNFIYCCMECRHWSRSNFVDQIIEILIHEDKKQEFLRPFWLTAGNANYLNVISQPICFQDIKETISSF